MVKSVVVLVAWIAMLIWAFVATDGGGDLFTQKSSIEGSAHNWAFLGSLTSLIGNYTTLIINQVHCKNLDNILPTSPTGKR